MRPPRRAPHARRGGPPAAADPAGNRRTAASRRAKCVLFSRQAPGKTAPALRKARANLQKTICFAQLFSADCYFFHKINRLSVFFPKFVRFSLRFPSARARGQNPPAAPGKHLRHPRAGACRELRGEADLQARYFFTKRGLYLDFLVNLHRRKKDKIHLTLK